MKKNYFSYDIETADMITAQGRHIMDYMKFFEECNGKILKESGIPFSELRPGKPAEDSIDERLILMA
jgi:hypothetical protein